jgi:hypothetical protein
VAQDHGQRQQVEHGTASGTLSNASAFTITSSATATASATHFTVWDASASGNLLFYGQLTTAKTIADGDEVKFNTLVINFNCGLDKTFLP